MNDSTEQSSNLEGTQSEVQCAHHWVIGSPHSSKSSGECKICGEKKEFFNTFEYSSWTTSKKEGEAEKDKDENESESEDENENENEDIQELNEQVEPIESIESIEDVEPIESIESIEDVVKPIEKDDDKFTIE